MLKLREKLGEYQEIFYMIFLLSMTGMNSIGINSEDGIYMIVFVVATLFLLLKMAVTDFTWKEILVMAVFTGLFGANFLRNGEKTLILTAMGIFGAKNVDLDKVFKYALWEKAVLTIGTLSLAALGVIENTPHIIPKNWVAIEIYDYGYYHPNMAFANIFVVLLLAMLVYGDRIKWYAYVVGTAIMLLAYKVFMCRTGLVVWILLCVMVLGYRVMKHFRKEKVYMALFTAIPAVLAALTLVIPVLTKENAELELVLNKLLTGRIRVINTVYDEVWKLVLGHVPQSSFDNMYFHGLYNYGWILFILCFIAYIAGMWYCNRKGKFYGTIALGIMAVYGYMELLPLSVLWNLPLLYLSGVLFREQMKVDEQLQ